MQFQYEVVQVTNNESTEQSNEKTTIDFVVSPEEEMPDYEEDGKLNDEY